MDGSTQKSPVRHKNALPSMHQLTLPLSNTPHPHPSCEKYFFPFFYVSPAPWEISHLAAAVIVTRAHRCLTAAGHCYVMLGTIRFVDKSVNDNSARRLNNCDVIALRSGFGVAWPLVCRTAKLNSKPSLSHLQQLIWDQTQINTRIEHL